VGVFESHKLNSAQSRGSGSEGGSEATGRDCSSQEERFSLFRFRLPSMTLELIKAKHGNVSEYLRELIAQDLGEDAFPAQRRRKPSGETDLKVLAEIGKPTKKRSKKKHANGSRDHYKIGRIHAPKRKTNQN
jgi:hypothetical protein